MNDSAWSACDPNCDALHRRIAELSSENARLTEAVAARDAFLVIAAHELRNPMTPILGRVTLLRRTLQREGVSLDDVARGIDQVETLVKSFINRATMLLDVSRITSDELMLDRVPVELCTIVEEVTATFGPAASYAGSALEVDVGVSRIEVLADAVALEQIVENVLSNAIKYGAGQPIVVRVRRSPCGRMASVVVRDHGPGITADDKARIFERFERAVRPGERIPGFGIGLWVVRNLCHAMGGTVEVDSTIGEGTTFTIVLPTADRGTHD